MSWLVQLLAPDVEPGTYNDWRLVTETTLPALGQWVLAALVVAAVALSARSVGRVAGLRRAVLIGLRAAAAVWVLILVLEPAIELMAVSRVRTRVALMVDASRSMGLATPAGTRAQAVLRHFDENAGVFARLEERAVIERMTFGERTQPVEAFASPPEPTESKTDVARALGEVTGQASGRELGAVILYSDGADTEGLTPEAARRKAAQVGAPIYAVGFKKNGSAPDLAIRRVIADDFTFVYNTVSLEVEIEERGLGLSEVLVTLKRDGTVMKTQRARLDGGTGRVNFSFKPTQIGKQVYEISVPVQAAETVPDNNAKSLVLKVIRDRIRVLQVAGRPSWDVRYLRELLKKNPNVDLISFFILRSTTDLQKAPADELALIPFPVNELFTTELGSFDVVIYQNFTYRPYRMAGYLDNVRRYVREQGKSFLMIGGDLSFEDGWYAGTEIADILPVQIGGALPWDEASYRPRLTKKGRRHPVTRIQEAGEPPEAAYRRLPRLTGINPSVGLVPGAQALLVHPQLPGNPPVVAIREFARGGRTMAVTTDSMWFWRFVAVGQGGAGREFDRFWNNALRWLIRDPDLARVRLSARHSVVLKGEPVGAEVLVLGPDYRGLAGASVRAELIPVSGSRPENEFVVELETGADGKGVLRYEGVPSGTYTLRARARRGSEPIGTAYEPIIVEAAEVERQDPFPRPEILRALAEGSGGRFIDVSERLPEIEIQDARRVEVDRTRRIPIWNGALAFLVLLVLAGAEWWLRRRAGLL